ncbi:glycosyltransferase [Lactobacillus ultunensis DSM 16047]|nr:glycosyltransferase [Lactobacillus ultunensis DSM 16047]
MFKKISDFIFTQKIKSLIKRKKPKAIYFTTPLSIDFLPKDYNGKIIYDCMDDNLNLDNDPTIKELENDLIKKADDVLVTSVNLQNILIKRYGYEIRKKLHLVRNGFSGKILKVPFKIYSDKKIELAYIGSVARWFDFDLLKKSLKRFPNLEYTIIGPVDDDIKILDPRIHFLGTVEHERLYENIKNARALIMPFKLNKIIESVDPVKLYEYINFNKDIITIKYPEVERFNNFVYFYKDEEEFFTQIRRIVNTKSLKFSQTERRNFLLQNNWDKRAEQIYQIIEGKYI